jgi:hypothetical protein
VHAFEEEITQISLLDNDYDNKALSSGEVSRLWEANMELIVGVNVASWLSLRGPTTRSSLSLPWGRTTTLFQINSRRDLAIRLKSQRSNLKMKKMK